MVSSPEVYLYQRTTYFRDGPDPICFTMPLTVYSRSSTIGLLARLGLLVGDGGTSEADIACGVCVWCEYDKGVDVDIDVGWDT